MKQKLSIVSDTYVPIDTICIMIHDRSMWNDFISFWHANHSQVIKVIAFPYGWNHPWFSDRKSTVECAKLVPKVATPTHLLTFPPSPSIFLGLIVWFKCLSLGETSTMDKIRFSEEFPGHLTKREKELSHILK